MMRDEIKKRVCDAIAESLRTHMEHCVYEKINYRADVACFTTDLEIDAVVSLIQKGLIELNGTTLKRTGGEAT